MIAGEGRNLCRFVYACQPGNVSRATVTIVEGIRIGDRIVAQGDQAGQVRQTRCRYEIQLYPLPRKWRFFDRLLSQKPGKIQHLLPLDRRQEVQNINECFFDLLQQFPLLA
jgi:hypothetical protein